MKKLAVVDMDGTLAKPRMLTRCIWRIARKIFEFGRLTEKRNNQLFLRLQKYDEVIVLTARTANHRAITEWQLRNFAVTPRRIIFCPINRVVYEWKKSELQKIGHKLDWYDDLNFSYGVESGKQ